MHRTARFVLLSLLGLAAGLLAEPPVTRSELLGHIKKLASEEWEGRAAGSAGEQKATEYIRKHFERLGLEAAGEEGGYFQTVPMAAGHEVGAKTSLRLKGTQGQKRALALGKEFTALSISSSAVVEGEPVFAGYGISLDKDYDDYAGIDVAGKVVFVFRHLPEADAKLARPLQAKASFVAKQQQAAAKGAIALVVVNDPRSFPEARGKNRARPDALMTRGVGGEGKIPCIHLTLAAGREIFPALFRSTPEQLEERIGNPKGAPRALALPGKGRVRIETQIERKTILGRNVCARLRSKSKQPLDGVVVVGAHHDHLGRGKYGSLERDPKARNAIHNGADDNASGTSGLLEIAEYLAARPDRLRRDVLFLTFTGEERGLLGSRYWCAKPTVPLKELVAMINMDMIGRLDGGRLFIGGTGTSPVWAPMLTRLTAHAGLEVDFGPGGRAPSDNTSFYDKQLPVLFFFTGLHEQYHRPDDDWQRIDVEAIEKIATLAAATVEATANLEKRPEFRRADQGGGGPPRPVLGISLGGNAAGGGGVSVGGVAPGGPAARAGLLPGDVILELAGRKTPGLRALRQILQNCRIGQKVVVKVRRGEEQIEVEIALGAA